MASSTVRAHGRSRSSRHREGGAVSGRRGPAKARAMSVRGLATLARRVRGVDIRSASSTKRASLRPSVAAESPWMLGAGEAP